MNGDIPLFLAILGLGVLFFAGGAFVGYAIRAYRDECVCVLDTSDEAGA